MFNSDILWIFSKYINIKNNATTIPCGTELISSLTKHTFAKSEWTTIKWLEPVFYKPQWNEMNPTLFHTKICQNRCGFSHEKIHQRYEQNKNTLYTWIYDKHVGSECTWKQELPHTVLLTAKIYS